MPAACAVCGTEQAVRPSVQAGGNGHYCSRACAHAGKRRPLKGMRGPEAWMRAAGRTGARDLPHLLAVQARGDALLRSRLCGHGPEGRGRGGAAGRRVRRGAPGRRHLGPGASPWRPSSVATGTRATTTPRTSSSPPSPRWCRPAHTVTARRGGGSARMPVPGATVRIARTQGTDSATACSGAMHSPVRTAAGFGLPPGTPRCSRHSPRTMAGAAEELRASANGRYKAGNVGSHPTPCLAVAWGELSPARPRPYASCPQCDPLSPPLSPACLHLLSLRS